MSNSPVSTVGHPPAPQPETNVWPVTLSGSRVLQACNVCRRRKTKCNGVRPTCGNCILRRLPCSWPMTQSVSPPVDKIIAAAQNTRMVSEELEEPLQKRIRQSKSGRSQRYSSHLSVRLLQRALDIFYARHYSIEFCSFLHVSSLDVEVLRQRSPFLAHALIALSGLYMNTDEAVREGFATPVALSNWHTIVAREYSRQSVDAPSISSVQANLVLALKELLARTSYKAWIFTGVAIRQAQALRLGVEYHAKLSNRQKEVQRRTYWASFIMDRLIAQCCWRPQMIDSVFGRLNLPCPENLFTFDEPFEGFTIDKLPFPCDVARLGLIPYFIAALNLWSQAAYIQAKGEWRLRPRSDEQESFLRQVEEKIDDFYSSLPSNMQWSTRNRTMFRHTNQEGQFINFHFLLNHARCIMRQEYLPYGDGPTLNTGQGALHENFEGSGIPYTDGRDEKNISVCVSSSERIISMASDLTSSNDSDREHLQSVFAASALLSAANIQLWLAHLGAKDEEIYRIATSRVEEVGTVFDSWSTQWPVAVAWSSTLAALRRLYQTTYAPNNFGTIATEDGPPQSGDVAGVDITTEPSSVLNEKDTHERTDPRLTDGNGLPEVNERMNDKIRFILVASLEDTEARDRVLNSSTSTVNQNSWDYDRFFEDLEYGFPELYTEDSWSAFMGNFPDCSSTVSLINASK